MEKPNHQQQQAQEDERCELIQQLNDQLRIRLEGGDVVVTPSVNALPQATQYRVLDAIRTFDDFNDENDPYGTHEFGNVEVDGRSFWFKIDAYDTAFEYGSPDPSDPEVTRRVMTILTPEEY